MDHEPTTKRKHSAIILSHSVLELRVDYSVEAHYVPSLTSVLTSQSPSCGTIRFYVLSLPTRVDGDGQFAPDEAGPSPHNDKLK